MVKNRSSLVLVLSLIFSINAKAISLKKAFCGGLLTAVCSILAYKTVKAIHNHPSRMQFDLGEKDITPESLYFDNKNTKEPFLWGVATSAYQVEGQEGASVLPFNQWQRCEDKEIEVDGEKSKPVPHVSGKACQHWKRYKQDIVLMKKLGFSAFRFSVSWGKIEPKKGQFSKSALDHYEDVCKELVKNGIKPVITLHHYTHPCWFEDMGGFEKEENITYFVRFCKTVFKRLNKYAPLWFTFNTFTGYSLAGYSQGMKPPFKKSMALAIEVLKNMLESHVRVYHALKQIDSDCTVGIYKNVFQIDPWNLLNPLDHLFSYLGNYLSNNAIYNYFTTGEFNVWIPFKVSMKHANKNAIGALDCIGLNYY